MRYSLEPSYRRYVQGQGFMSFAKNIGNKYGKKIFDKSIDVGKSMKKKYGKKILDNILSAGKDFVKIAGKKVLTKSAEATGDLIGNKIADRITKSTRDKAQKEDDRITEETQEIIIPPEKREQIIRDLKIILIIIHIKWNTIKLITDYFLKIMKNYLNLLLENMLELIVYSIRITKINQLDLKHLC